MFIAYQEEESDKNRDKVHGGWQEDCNGDLLQVLGLCDG